ncbi:sugar phosphate isomerase/epimerase family protein [Streptomyces radicis]|uniref:Sugar phosphate isomerase/epimerase n=1 Tax=Streptomyces radicis TaxID=1750517 RepID=A0A3A9VZ99_9ACTN|nr:sugar phosphate isomerase/epimerase [Streptomyces radicis]RKN06268.1 sugar phosphate isomerase/epimerase [Streptomyces radicis]RKN18598.1 sugar phosphate isomerase/epimerase [Streptomyces radicis]
MCYGISNDRALAEARAHHGPGRRSLLRGAVVGAFGAAALGAGGAASAQATPRGRGGWGRVLVPPGRISVQLYTLRADLNGEIGFDATLRELSDLGYPRVEQALGYFGRSAAELKDFYDDLDISCTSSHDGISADEAALETKLRNARTLRQSFVNVPYLSSPDKDQWKIWAEQMNREAEAARRFGLRYGYHNHAHEFTTDLGNGVTPWDVFMAELDPRLVHLEIDLYWAVTGGIESGDGVDDPEQFTIDVIRSSPLEVLQYHVKDRDPVTGDMADCGTGMIDFPRIFKAHKVREYIVENDTPDVTPIRSAEVGIGYLRGLRY